APDGSTVTAFTPHADAVSGAAFVVISPRHPEAERWASDPAIAEQLEQMRSGGWVRSARDAETIPVIQANTTMTDPSGRALPVLISPVVDARFGPTIALGVPGEDRTD